ncbi:hypothetical protein SAMN05518670_0624 [Paenibacillus sp. OK076]|nr:hypothetical protein SAMN05518670_0624 [Paenibacillus sp. OK076]
MRRYVLNTLLVEVMYMRLTLFFYKRVISNYVIAKKGLTLSSAALYNR